MVISMSRIRAVFAAVVLGLTVAGCGYNNIPTYEEQAKAKWADVQNNYQRRADLIPNLVSTVQGYARQERDVLTAVVEARAKATQVRIDVSQLTDPDKLKQFQDAQNQLSGALGRLLAVSENYPTSSQTRIFWRSSRSSKAPKIALQWRGVITSNPCGSTTPNSRPSRAFYGPRPSSAPTSRWQNHRGRKCAGAAASEILIRPQDRKNKTEKCNESGPHLFSA